MSVALFGDSVQGGGDWVCFAHLSVHHANHSVLSQIGTQLYLLNQ